MSEITLTNAAFRDWAFADGPATSEWRIPRWEAKRLFEAYEARIAPIQQAWERWVRVRDMPSADYARAEAEVALNEALEAAFSVPVAEPPHPEA